MQTTTNVGGGTAADFPFVGKRPYEDRALAALNALALKRNLAPDAAVDLLVKTRVVTNVGSLRVVRRAADEYARLFAFDASRTVANDDDLAFLRRHLRMR